MTACFPCHRIRHFFVPCHSNTNYGDNDFSISESSSQPAPHIKGPQERAKHNGTLTGGMFLALSNRSWWTLPTNFGLSADPRPENVRLHCSKSLWTPAHRMVYIKLGRGVLWNFTECIKLDGNVVKVGNTYANNYNIFVHLDISLILLDFPDIVPGATSISDIQKLDAHELQILLGGPGAWTSRRSWTWSTSGWSYQKRLMKLRRRSDRVA